MKEYPYKARFAAFARAVIALENDKQIATAALNDLANVFRAEEVRAKILTNPDLLFFASNLALLDYANLNDDCLRKEDGLKYYKNFILKLVDVEHKRDDIVGSIYEAGFSLFGSNKMISYEEALATQEPVQLVVGGYLWRIVAEELCDFIESASMESSPNYGKISTSFEVAFDSYDIAVSNGSSRYIGDAEIIKPGEPKFEVFKPLLRCNGGKGKTDRGQIVYRVLGGDLLPLGAGIVERPASGLKGILHVDTSPTDEEQKKNKEEYDAKAKLISEELGKIAQDYKLGIDPSLNPEEKDGYAEILVKLEKIDKAFNISATEIAEAIQRVGATAKDAGVSFDTLIAWIVEAKKSTGRSGAIIGNAIKTILVKGEPFGLLQESVAAALNFSKQSQNTDIKPLETSVTTNTTTLSPMKIKSFDELAQNWTEIKKLETVASVITDLKEVAEASTRTMIEDAIAKKSEEFAKELQTQKDLAKNLETAKASSEAQAKELADEVKTLKQELEQIKAAQLAQAAEDKYNERMTAMEDEFELDADDRALLVDEIKSIPDDETFAKYMAKCKKLMAGKKKAKGEFPPKKEVKPGEKPEDKKEVKAAEVVASVTEIPGQEVPNTTTPTVSLRDKVRAIMGESVTIGTIKAADLLSKKKE